MKKIALSSLAAIPIIIIAVFMYAAFLQGNPGIKLDKTQSGLLISGIYHHQNDVRKGDLIIGIHGLSYQEMMGYALGLYTKKPDAGLVILRENQTLYLPFNTRPFTILELFELIDVIFHSVDGADCVANAALGMAPVLLHCFYRDLHVP